MLSCSTEFHVLIASKSVRYHDVIVTSFAVVETVFSAEVHCSQTVIYYH